MNNISTENGYQPVPPESNHSNGLYGRMMQDFYLSFLFSQGIFEYQALFVEALGMDYRASLTDEDMRHMPNLLPELEDGAMRLMPPKAHRLVSEKDRVDVLATEWGKFSNMLNSLTSKTQDEDELMWREQHMDLAQAMLMRDYHFCLPRESKPEGGRPNPNATQDPFESHFREYVLLGKRTGSESFDRIFSRVQYVYLEDTRHIKVRHVLNELRKLWREQHLSEPFIPPRTAPDTSGESNSK